MKKNFWLVLLTLSYGLASAELANTRTEPLISYMLILFIMLLFGVILWDIHTDNQHL